MRESVAFQEILQEGRKEGTLARIYRLLPGRIAIAISLMGCKKLKTRKKLAQVFPITDYRLPFSYASVSYTHLTLPTKA